MFLVFLCVPVCFKCSLCSSVFKCSSVFRMFCVFTVFQVFSVFWCVSSVSLTGDSVSLTEQDLY